MYRYYQIADAADPSVAELRAALAKAGATVQKIEKERCFMVALEPGAPKLTDEQEERLLWLLTETFEPEKTRARQSFLGRVKRGEWMVEVGARLTFCTAWSSNAVAICKACGLPQVARMEYSRRYLVKTSKPLTEEEKEHLSATLYDRMTECVYDVPLETFTVVAKPAPVRHIPVLSQGRAALEAISNELGFGFDEADIVYYTNLFQNELKRDPTDVECFDMAQSNSEHSRHWYFGGKIVVNGVEKPKTLFQLVKSTIQTENAKKNSIIAFHDNSSVIRGFPVKALRPTSAVASSPFATVDDVQHILLTAETHNFPSGVAPFPGAETGTGGRIRDVQATGRGAYVVAGISAYCTGNLQIPGYELPWEDSSFAYPENLASPLKIMVQASNGASDYGNKFGEPVLCGFARSFGMRLPNGERREWLKPIMFSAGIGQLPAGLADKGKPEPGMWVVKVGGPAYRIGMGGGAASSRLQDKSQAKLDFDAVQRGDAEMENKMNRVIRACVELGDRNPIVSIHDQGAGGNGNVLKEICEPLGAKLQVRSILSGDSSLSVLELWGAEYQENCALLLKTEHVELFKQICAREQSPSCFLGQVTGDGRLVLADSADNSTPVDLPLSLVLGEMPQKTFESTREAIKLSPLKLPKDLQVETALDRVLRLSAVGSKRYLTNKVDRSVTGLIAQQQCVGPFHTPLADVGVIAQTHLGITGGATAVGEQPIKGLLSPAAMGRLSVAEAVTNLMFAAVNPIDEVKCSANWMWAAKLPGEGAAMYDACEAMSDLMKSIGVAVDGGKDSLSMAARVGDETVKAPGALVVTVYAACEDVRLTLTPDLKSAGAALLHVDVANGKRRLGGTALAQVFNQLGDTPPDVEEPQLLAKAFTTVQSLLRQKKLLSGHDISDGGILVAALEMAFAGDLGLELKIDTTAGEFESLFAEEVGVLLEVSSEHESAVLAAFAEAGVPCTRIGISTEKKAITVISASSNRVMLAAEMPALRDVWEATSFALEMLQCNPECVKQEQSAMSTRHAPDLALTFSPVSSAPHATIAETAPRVAVIRQEGSNGDREMAAAFFAAGMAPWDVSMYDLASGNVRLDGFRGVVFVGGFSYADVLDSAKGWAGVVKYNSTIQAQFNAFKARSDTFSLGVCNGCQLMALMGWVPSTETLPQEHQPRFIHNTSGRYESRWVSVVIQPSPAVLLRGMEGSSLGVWVAHGEGKAHFPHEPVLDNVLEKQLAPLRYIDDDCAVTTAYPFNPNGSPHGIAALCSDDGRHLAMMPHPERAYLKWQCPWLPKQWETLDAMPWLRMFQNALAFCESTNADK
uniref:phosphoribosylformylglycinamidine synthase n=1 Tax=Chrysotila carterae TaxID=13221 RepID=A0A7S4EUI8_CHRCT